MMEKCYVYWIHLDTHDDVTSQGYVGVSVNPEVRWKQRYNPIVDRVREKYKDRIKHTILFSGTQENCYNRENDLRPKEAIGWNLAIGGFGIQVGHSVSEETKEKLRQANLGKKHSEETIAKMCEDRSGEKHPMFGRKHSKETLDKLCKPKTFKTCHCGEVMRNAQMYGKHFDNCNNIG